MKSSHESPVLSMDQTGGPKHEWPVPSWVPDETVGHSPLQVMPPHNHHLPPQERIMPHNGTQGAHISWREGANCSRVPLGPPHPQQMHHHHQHPSHHINSYDEAAEMISNTRPVHAMLGIKTEPDICEEQMEACAASAAVGAGMTSGMPNNSVVGSHDATYMNSLRDMGLTDSTEFSAVLTSLLSQFGMNVPGVSGNIDGNCGMEGIEGAGVITHGDLPDVVPSQGGGAHYAPQQQQHSSTSSSSCQPSHQELGCGNLPGLVPCARLPPSLMPPNKQQHHGSYEHQYVQSVPQDHSRMNHEASAYLSAERQINHEEEFNWDKLL